MCHIFVVVIVEVNVVMFLFKCVYMQTVYKCMLFSIRNDEY